MSLLPLNEQQQRYISLDGTPLHATFMQAAVHSPVAKVAAMTAAFNLVALQAGSVEAVAAIALGTVAGAMASLGGQKLIDLMYLMDFGTQRNTLCIDKRPDSSTPPTSPAHVNVAREIRQSSFFNTLLGSLGSFGVFATIISSDSLNQKIPIVFAMAGASAFSALVSGLTTSLGSMGLRFNNVARGNWVITDLPKRIEEKKPVEIPNALPHIG